MVLVSTDAKLYLDYFVSERLKLKVDNFTAKCKNMKKSCKNCVLFQKIVYLKKITIIFLIVSERYFWCRLMQNFMWIISSLNA